MSTYKHTKILATLSPAVSTPNMLSEFINSGVNVFRLNFSHGTHDEYREIIRNIKKIRQEKSTNTAILQDLQGPRVRVSRRESPLLVEIGDKVYVTPTDTEYHLDSDAKVLSLDHDLTSILNVGEKLLIEDGLIELEIEEIQHEKRLVICKSNTNASIGGRKGVNFPGSSSDFPVITDKDKEDLRFGLSQDVNMVAMSFVRNAKDIIELRSLIDEYSEKEEKPLVFAKIEKPEAVENLELILNEVDGIMVARGDLGIEIEAEKVPVVQKKIIDLCLHYGKPVIVATQMLDSMIRNSRPTRAEVSDVANAVIDHADAVMLSGETSSGLYPLQAVEMMRRIILATEESTYDDYLDEEVFDGLEHNFYRDLAYGAQHLARKSFANGIVILDRDGLGVAEYMSEFRVEVPVFTITANQSYHFQTAISWGVTSLCVEDSNESEMHAAINLVKRRYYKESLDTELYFVVVDVTHKHQESIQMFVV